MILEIFWEHIWALLPDLKHPFFSYTQEYTRCTASNIYEKGLERNWKIIYTEINNKYVRTDVV